MSAWHLRPREERQEELLERVGARVELQPLLPGHDEPAGQAGRPARRGVAVGGGRRILRLRGGRAVRVSAWRGLGYG